MNLHVLRDLPTSGMHVYRGDVWRVIGWWWPGDAHRGAMQDLWYTHYYRTFRDASPLLRSQ